MPESAASPPADHEEPDVGTAIILRIAAGVVVLAVAALALIAMSFLWREGNLPLPVRSGPPPAVFPEPRLQVRPAADLARMRRDAAAKLDAQAALPIERAMAVIARRGPDAFAPLVPPRDPTPGAPP